MANEFDISHLSPVECILLADQLWEQARAHAEAIPVTAEQVEELHRRLDALDGGKMEPGEKWDIVRERLWGQ